MGVAIFRIGVLSACVQKNIMLHNITKQLVSKHTELIENDSNNAILSLK